MVARNPYQLDPLLAEGFSNLTRALVGDPQSDVYGARADLLRQQVQQSKASANASNSLAALRAEQRRLEALKTARFGDLQNVASEPNALLANAMLTTLGEQGAEMDALGNVVKIQPEGAPLQSVPYKIDPTTGTGTDLGVNNLTNAMFGNLDFTPAQFATALTELGAGRQSSLARAILLDPDASIEAKAGAFQSMGKSPGQYFDPSFANSELVETLASAERTSAATDASKLDGVRYTARQNRAAQSDVADIKAQTVVLKDGETAFVNGSVSASAPFTLKADETRFVRVNGVEKQYKGSETPTKIVVGEGQTGYIVGSDGKVIKQVTGTSKGVILRAGEDEVATLIVDGKEVASITGPKSEIGTSSSAIQLSASSRSALVEKINQTLTAKGYGADSDTFPDLALQYIHQRIIAEPGKAFQSHKNIDRAIREVTNAVGPAIKMDKSPLKSGGMGDEVVFNDIIVNDVKSILSDQANVADGMALTNAQTFLINELGYNPKQAANIIEYAQGKS